MAKMSDEEEETQEFEDEDDAMAEFLEAEIMHRDFNDEEEDEQPVKRRRVEEDSSGIESGEFKKIPQELFRNILKFLSSEDLSSVAKVCQYLRCAASDEQLWRRLYCLRWGLPPNVKSTKNGVEWKQLYFERDSADVGASMKNAPPEFKEYYMQMQVAKRSQAPLPSQIKDELWVVDQSVADQVTTWRRSRKLADVYTGSHTCSGKTCSYHQIGDIFLCEKTGCAHVCGDACRETFIDPSNYLHVCAISGRCFDPCIFPVQEEDDDESNGPQQGAIDEPEPCLGSARLARAYCLGYSCKNDREFERALRCC